eukprot:794412-Pelagomonas_calceolata.AAC.3
MVGTSKKGVGASTGWHKHSWREHRAVQAQGKAQDGASMGWAQEERVDAASTGWREHRASTGPFCTQTLLLECSIASQLNLGGLLLRAEPLRAGKAPCVGVTNMASNSSSTSMQSKLVQPELSSSMGASTEIIG